MDKFIYEKDLIGALNKAFLAWSNMPEWREKKIIEEIENLPSAQYKPLLSAQDIAKIIENEHDIRVILKNANRTEKTERECCECKYYDGVHGVMGHAPCSFWKIGGVLWNDFCSRWEAERREDE